MFFLRCCALWQQEYYKVIANFPKCCVRHMVNYQLKSQQTGKSVATRANVTRSSRSAYVKPEWCLCDAWNFRVPFESLMAEGPRVFSHFFTLACRPHTYVHIYTVYTSSLFNFVLFFSISTSTSTASCNMHVRKWLHWWWSWSVSSPEMLCRQSGRSVLHISYRRRMYRLHW